MFYTTRYFFPHGDESEAMDNTFKEWPTFEKALAYCYRYAKGCRFAGVKIEDEQGCLLFELLDNGDAHDYREELAAQDEKANTNTITENTLINGKFVDLTDGREF